MLVGPHSVRHARFLSLDEKAKPNAPLNPRTHKGRARGRKSARCQMVIF
jgi:hypothetical protein